MSMSTRRALFTLSLESPNTDTICVSTQWVCLLLWSTVPVISFVWDGTVPNGSAYFCEVLYRYLALCGTVQGKPKRTSRVVALPQTHRVPIYTLLTSEIKNIFSLTAEDKFIQQFNFAASTTYLQEKFVIFSSDKKKRIRHQWMEKEMQSIKMNWTVKCYKTKTAPAVGRILQGLQLDDLQVFQMIPNDTIHKRNTE